MLSHEFGRGVVEISPDCLDQFMNGSTDRLRNLADSTFKDSREIISAKGFSVPKNAKWLFAHGNSQGNSYKYIDRDTDMVIPFYAIGTWHSVDDWIDKNQSEFDLLIVTVCNTHGVSIASRERAGILYPSSFANHQQYLLAGENGFIHFITNPKYAANINGVRYAPPIKDRDSRLTNDILRMYVGELVNVK